MTPRKPLSPEETKAWVEKYRRDAFRYAWGFWAVFTCAVFALVSWEMKGFTPEAYASAAVAGAISAGLALNMRARQARAWQGVLSRKWIEQRRIRHAQQHDEWVDRPRAEVSTRSGKKIRLRLTPRLFDYFEEGDLLLKPAGFDWPLRLPDTDQAGRVCICCGFIMDAADGGCPGCGAPRPDLQMLKQLAGF